MPKLAYIAAQSDSPSLEDLLTFTTVWAYSSDDSMIFSYSTQKIGSDLSCKLSKVDNFHVIWKPIFWEY